MSGSAIDVPVRDAGNSPQATQTATSVIAGLARRADTEVDTSELPFGFGDLQDDLSGGAPGFPELVRLGRVRQRQYVVEVHAQFFPLHQSGPPRPPDPARLAAEQAHAAATV